MQKKLLLLGGSSQQVVAIETAKRLGYYTILCDFLPDNPGQHVADTFYLVSTTDKEAVYEVARTEQINGILAYASDPAAPTAAYVAEKMGLPGNPYASVELLCNKDAFRAFLAEHGFCAPKANGYTCLADALHDIESGVFSYPLIVKPVDSSGSKGVTVLRDLNGLKEALEFAFSFSRGKRVIVEEFIEKKHPYLIGGDIFIVDGKIRLWGLLNCHRDPQVNPLVPVGKSYPLMLESADEMAVRQTLQSMVDKLGIRFGAMNVELVVDQAGRVWPIDVGPRNGGNMIPDLLGYIFNVDIVDLTVRMAMGQSVTLNPEEGKHYYATHNLHSNRNGKFAGITFSQELAPYILRKSIYKKPGDPVEYFDNSTKALGIVFLKFPNQESMSRLLGQINTHIAVRLEADK